MRTIKVLPVGDKLVTHQKALEANVIRYVGRRFDPASKWFVATGQVVELEYHADYLQALKVGDLAPADEDTAKLCGQKFVAKIEK